MGWLALAAANAGYGAWLFAVGDSPAWGAFNVAAAVLCFGMAVRTR